MKWEVLSVNISLELLEDIIRSLMNLICNNTKDYVDFINIQTHDMYHKSDF